MLRTWGAPAAAVVTMVVYKTAPPGPGALVYLTLCAAAVGVVFYQGCKHRHGIASWWTLLVGALALWLVADAFWFIMRHGAPPGSSALAGHEAAYLLAYPLLAVALWGVARRTGGNRDRELILDSLIIAAGFAVVVSVYVLTPESTQALGSLAYPVIDVMLLGLVIRILLSVTGRRNICARLMTVGFVGLLAGGIVDMWLQQHTTHPSGTVLDYARLAFFVLMALAVAHPSAAALTSARPVAPAPSELTTERLVALASAILVVPVVRLVQHLTGRPGPGMLGMVVGIVVTVLVVTRIAWLARDAGRARQHAAAEAARFLRLADNAEDIVFRYTLSPTPGYEYVSPSVEQALGYGQEYFYANPLAHRSLILGEDWPASRAFFARIPEAQGSWVNRWVHRDGTIRWLDIRTSAVFDSAGGLVAVEGITRDVTDRVAAEERLRQQAHWQAAVAEFGTMALGLRDKGTVLEEAHLVIARTSGLNDVRILDPSALIRLLPDEVVVPIPASAGYELGAFAVTAFPDGRTTEEVRSFLQAIAQIVAQALARITAEDAREQPFRSLAENSPDLIVRFDRRLHLSYANHLTLLRSDQPSSTLVGLHVRALPAPARLLAAVEARLRQVFATAQPTWDEEPFTDERTGEKHYLNLRYVPEVGGSEVDSVLLVIQDVTAQRRARDQLEHTVGLLRRTDELRRRVLAGLVNAETEERKRIASDIHDDSIQVMVATGMRLHALRRRIGDDPGVGDLLEKLADTVETSVGRLRQLMFGLHPYELEAGGLLQAVEHYAVRTFDGVGPKLVSVSTMGDDPPEDVATIVYRIAQEAIANAYKHAKANTMRIALSDREGGVLLEVRDDGVGFCPSDLPPTGVPGHLGLHTIKERASLAGGWLTVDSSPNDGTTLRTWIPVQLTSVGALA